MAVDGIRFLHASDLHLGAPLFGVGGLPYHLRSIMVNARYRAAQRMFDAAIAQQVDFIVLAGGVIAESAAGPRPSWFLAERCEALAKYEIPIYWFEPPSAASRWSDYVPIPSNVFVGDSQIGQTFDHRVDGRPPARVLGGEGCRFAIEDSKIPQIAVLPEGLGGLPLSPVGIDYWALGGRSTAGAAPSVSGLARFSGSTQGQGLSESGPRGCQLVTIDHERECRSTFLETDAVRWHNVRTPISEDCDWSELQRELRRRQEHLIAGSDCDLLMIRWVLEGHGPLWRQLRRDDVLRQLQSKLVRHGRDRRPAAWSMVIDLLPDSRQFAIWEGEESTSGDAVRRLRAGRRDTVIPEPHFDRASVDRGVPLQSTN